MNHQGSQDKKEAQPAVLQLGAATCKALEHLLKQTQLETAGVQKGLFNVCHSAAQTC